MEYESPKAPPVGMTLDNVHKQEQSLFFTMLPLDIRRQIYLQLWLSYGTTQHIYCFGKNCRLSHYPCMLEKYPFRRCFKHLYRPPQSLGPPPLDHIGEAADLATDDISLETESHAQIAADVGAQVVEDHNEPEPYDDPGDIDGAIQEISAQQPRHTPADISGSSDSKHYPRCSPWCMHAECFQAYMEVYDASFERGYSSNYKRACRAATTVIGITKPLLLCKEMYFEASESLYSTMSFSFPNMSMLERFMTDVTAAMRNRIQVVDVMSTTIYGAGELPWPGRRSLSPQDTLPPLFTMCNKLKSLLPNVQELRLCLHPAYKYQDMQPRRLPSKEWFEPLYHLFNEMKQQNLRKLEVKLVTRYDMTSSENEDAMGYGSTPKFLRDAPFSVVLVPHGFHPDSYCCVYLNMEGGEQAGRNWD